MKKFKMNTKSRSLIVVSLLFFSCSTSRIIENNYVKMLRGSWTYIESRDEEGKKIESNDGMRVLMNQPNLIYESNFTYRKIFTSENSDEGKWKFNKKIMTIEHDLFIDSTQFIGKNLIKDGLVKKESDDKYYQKDDAKIIKLTNDEMILQGYGIQIVYKKD